MQLVAADRGGAARAHLGRAEAAQLTVAGAELARAQLVTAGIELVHTPAKCGDLSRPSSPERRALRHRRALHQ
jgi:hypothetical protein